MRGMVNMVSGPSIGSLIRLGLIIGVLIVVGMLITNAWITIHSMVMELFPGVAQSEAQRQIAENTARTAEIHRQAAFDAEWGPRLETIKSVATLLLWLVVGLAPVLAVLAGFMWVMSRVRMPDASGLPPSFKWGKETDQVKIAFMESRLRQLEAVATKQMVPETWSPTYSPTYDAPAPVQPAIAIPNLASLLALPEFVLGTDETGPITVSGELKSMGYGGKSGSGKTNTAVFHGIQIVNNGGHLYIGDPHLGNDRSIQSYMGPFASAVNMVGPDHTEILNLVREFHNEWKSRKRQRQSDDWPVKVLLLDEWTELLKSDNADAFMDMIADIIRGGAKYFMVTWLLSQNWAAASTGGNAVRNILNWSIAHQMRKNEVGMMTGMAGAAVPVDVGELEPGNAYVFGLPVGTKRIRVPQVTVEELVALPAPDIKALPLPNGDDKLASKLARIIREDTK